MNDNLLPNTWSEINLGYVAEVITKGTTPTTAGFQYTVSGIAFIKVENIDKNGINKPSVTQFISEEAHDSLKRSQLQVGDVLFSIAGTIGKTAFVNEEDLPANTNQAVAIIRGVSKVFYPKLLKYQLQMSADNIHKSKARGGAMNNISLTDLKSVQICFSSLAEQKVIADKLDSLLAQVETTKARLDGIPDIIKRFRQSVLAAAVSGRLTEEWRGRNVTESIEIAHNDKLPVIEQVDKYNDTIESWSWVRLGSVAQLINGDRGKNYPNKSEYVESGIPFINTGHIQPDGTLSERKMNFITREKYDALGSGKVQKNDLVYCLRGATMGKTARISYESGAIASSLVIVRPSTNIIDYFAYYFLISPDAKALISLYDNGSAQPNLSAKSLASYSIQLPPFEEQTEIVHRVEELFAFADAVEQKAQAASERVNKLTQSILAKAFRGELTADWRAANPDLISGENNAEALLEKIKAEREALKPKRKTRAKKVKS